MLTRMPNARVNMVFGVLLLRDTPQPALAAQLLPALLRSRLFECM